MATFSSTNSAYLVRVDERFYVGEHGFSFSVKTGINMAELEANEVIQMLRRPNGTKVTRVIPLDQIELTAIGQVWFRIEEDDLNVRGEYHGQVAIRDVSRNIVRTSHTFVFQVQPPVMQPLETQFP